VSLVDLDAEPSVERKLAMSERAWQAQVLAWARRGGWRVKVCRPCAPDDPGFPDLLLARAGCGLAAELKTAVGRLSRAQRAWLDTLSAVGLETYVWCPLDWPEARRRLLTNERRDLFG
jgi:hypothetical protein